MAVAKKARNFLENEIKRLRGMSESEFKQAIANLDLTTEDLRTMIDLGGLSPIQTSILTETQKFMEGNAGFDPALAVTTDILSGNTLNQGINQELTNNFTGNILGFGDGIGLNQPLQQIQDRAFDITNTQGAAGLNELLDAQRTAGDVISVGGFTPALQELKNVGLDLVRSGGFTSELKGFINQALGSIKDGATPEMLQLFKTAQEIIDAGGEGGSLMPTEQFISFARDEAAARGLDQFQAAQRRAVQSGLTPGAVTGSSGSLAEFADQQAQGDAKALRDASATMQDLRRQRELAAIQAQSGVASGTAQIRSSANSARGSINSAGIGAAAAGLNAGASLASSAGNAAASMFGSALSGMSNIGQIFADREQNAFQNLFGVNDAARANVGFASDLARSNIGDQLQGVSLFNQSRGFANDDILGALGLGANIGQAGQQNILGAAGLQSQNDQTRLQIAAQLFGMENAFAMQQAGLLAQPGFFKSLAMRAGNSLVDGATSALTGGLPFVNQGGSFSPQSIIGLDSLSNPLNNPIFTGTSTVSQPNFTFGFG